MEAAKEPARQRGARHPWFLLTVVLAALLLGGVASWLAAARSLFRVAFYLVCAGTPEWRQIDPTSRDGIYYQWGGTARWWESGGYGIWQARTRVSYCQFVVYRAYRGSGRGQSPLTATAAR